MIMYRISALKEILVWSCYWLATKNEYMKEQLLHGCRYSHFSAHLFSLQCLGVCSWTHFVICNLCIYIGVFVFFFLSSYNLFMCYVCMYEESMQSNLCIYSLRPQKKCNYGIRVGQITSNLTKFIVAFMYPNKFIMKMYIL